MKALLTFVSSLLMAAYCFAGQPVNINTADAQAIAEALDGVGLSKAEAIIRYREANGPFKHADELVKVKGIGLATVDKNREFIRFEGGNKLAKGG